MRDSNNDKLPEERQFGTVVWATCLMGLLFLYLFAMLTVTKAKNSPSDITANWFGAWGTWAGGLATAAAFLIAAFSIAVASAHARVDRQEAARIRVNNDMAQARLLVIYKVQMQSGIESLATFRIENRSKDVFFDVSVPYVDAPTDSGDGYERRTTDLVEADNRLHEFIPTAELLTAYRVHDEHEAWFTLVTVHTADWRKVEFAVDYTDAGGRRWRQHVNGQIEPVYTTHAIPVREADRFQPRQQIRRLSRIEAYREGGRFAEGMLPLEMDEEFLEVLEVRTVATWKRIELVGEPIVAPSTESTPGEVEVEVTFAPAGPPFWRDHLEAKLEDAGARYIGGSRGGRSETQKLRFPESAAGEVRGLLVEAIEHANNNFEELELAAARRALEAARLNREKRAHQGQQSGQGHSRPGPASGLI